MYRQQQPSIFKLGGFKRHHVVTFKTRDPKTSSPSILSIPATITTKKLHVEPATMSTSSSTTTTTSNSSSIINPFEFPKNIESLFIPPKKSTATATAPVKQLEEESDGDDDDIFDFPDIKESLEVKLMVASTRPVLKNNKKKSKKSKKPLPTITMIPKKTNSTETNTKKSSSRVALLKKKMPLPPPEGDVFAFDPNPAEINITHQSANTTVRPLDNTAILSYTTTRPYNYPISSLLNNTPVEKKRKRNLVAHLKGANGEKEDNQSRYDFQSSDEEAPSDLLPIREIIQKERSNSPELTYGQRMELELETMMQSEFGQVQQEQEILKSSKQRTQYQPMNKMNVKFTFQKKK